ncbi:MAG: NAD-dependent epimerase/dehydratase family protein [Gammaproteobacteria bacterium]
MAGNKVVITGAGGFVGRNLWQNLAKQHDSVIACLKSIPHEPLPTGKIVQLNLPNEQFETLLKDEQPDFLVHCAGGASVAQSVLHPDKDFHDNVLVTEHMLQSVLKSSPKTKIVFISSAAVYGNPVTKPIDETTPTNPISPYGFHKLMCELLCEKYHRLYHLSVSILRVFSVYGPHLKKQLLWDVYQKSCTQDVISLYGTGEETRDFIYIDDLANIITKVFQHSEFNSNIYNVGTGQESTVKQIVTVLLQKLGCTKPIQFTNQIKPGDPAHWALNIKSIEKLGITNFLPVQSGIEQFVRWLRTQTSQT